MKASPSSIQIWLWNCVQSKYSFIISLHILLGEFPCTCEKNQKFQFFFPWNNLFWFVRYCFRLREIKGCLLFFLWFYIFLNRLNTKRKRKRKKEKGASQKQSLNLFNCLCLYNLCVCNIYFWANWDLSWSGSLLLQPSWFFLRWVMTPLFDSLNFFLL